MDGALAYPPLLVTSAQFKCQREAENYSKLEDASGASLSLPLADCVLTLVASALKCVVNVRADNSLSSVSGNFQWVTISLEEIIGVTTSGPWLTVEYAPAAYTQWTRGVELAPSLSSISSERVLSLTLKVNSDEACFDIMEAILAAKMRLLRHLKWLEDRLPLTDKIFVCSVTALLPPGPEVVLAQCPDWDTVVALPDEWSRFVNGDLTLGAPAGTLSVFMQTHLGHSVVRLNASALEGRFSGKPKDGAVMAFYAQPCPAIQTTVAELAKHNSATYYTGSDLQAKLVLRWVDLSARDSGKGAHDGVLMPPQAPLTTAQALDSPVSSRPVPQLTPRHLLIAISFLIATLAVVVHHFVKQGKMSSGFLLLDLAAGVSLCGMLFAALPILASDAHEPAHQPEHASLPAAGSTAPGTSPQDSRAAQGSRPRWGLMLVQGDVVERDVDAEIKSEGTEFAPSVEDSARAESDSGAHEEEEDEVHTPEPARRTTPSRLHKLRTLQSSAHMNSIDLEQAVPPSPALGRRSTDHIMPKDIKEELMGLFPEPQWQPPHVDDNLVEDMVQRFYVGCKKDKEEAKRRLLVTKKFREENGVNTILHDPQPHFFEFKRVYPHGILNKRSKGGALIEIERVGGVRKAFESMMAKNIDKAELKKHMYFLSEYYDVVADPRPLPDGKLLKIMDIEGLGMYDVFGHIFNFLYECTNVGTMHYPERLHSMLIVNAPTWINMLWKAFTPAIDPATRERIQLCGSSKSSILKLMTAEMDMDVIPEEYGGRNTCKLEDSPHEKAMADFVRKVNEKHGVQAQ